MARYQFVSRPELPRFAGGAVGFLGYEAISFFEPKVPMAHRDDLDLPEMLFMLTSSVLIFDHQLRSLKIVVNAYLDDGPPGEVYARAAESIDEIRRQLTKSADLPLIPTLDCETRPARSNFRPAEFELAVEQAREYIRAGDVFQVVGPGARDDEGAATLAPRHRERDGLAPAQVARGERAGIRQELSLRPREHH